MTLIVTSAFIDEIAKWQPTTDTALCNEAWVWPRTLHFIGEADKPPYYKGTERSVRKLWDCVVCPGACPVHVDFLLKQRFESLLHTKRKQTKHVVLDHIMVVSPCILLSHPRTNTFSLFLFAFCYSQLSTLTRKTAQQQTTNSTTHKRNATTNTRNNKRMQIQPLNGKLSK